DLYRALRRKPLRGAGGPGRMASRATCIDNMTKTGFWLKRILVAVATLGVVAGAFLAGFVASDQHLFPSAQLLRVKSRLQAALGPAQPAQVTTELNTTLLR